MAGLRVAVKDNFDIKDVKTSLTSRPFYDTFPVKQNTATCIQRLIDLGATIVGKTKLTPLVPGKSRARASIFQRLGAHAPMDFFPQEVVVTGAQ